MVTNLLMLIFGFVFTFFIPGYLIMETFFPELPFIQKLPLYLLSSVLTSTYVVFLVSLAVGFSRFSIFLSFSIFGIWILILLVKRHFKVRIDLTDIREHAVALILSVVIFALFLIALYPAIFSFYQNYFVMSAVNWQDTAMHQSIIQSISQGNFPPQAPYFSGQPLNYYYFIDLHTAILQKLYGNFFPRILVYDNPFFALIFFLSLYALSYFFFRKKLAGIITGLLAVFSANFLYFRFFQDVYKNLNHQTGLITTVKDILATHSYTLDYGQLLQMAPMADYLLQNRPMMIGLPTIVLLILLAVNGFTRNSKKYFIMIGLLTGMLIKFQLFAFGVGILIFTLSWLIFAYKDFKRNLIKLFLYFVPLVIFVLLTSLFFNSNYAIVTFLTNFHFGPWGKNKDFFWYLAFPFMNFGILMLLSLFFTALIILRKINLTKNTSFLLIASLVLYTIPHIVYFTIYDGDMLKFLYFLLIPLSLSSGLLLQRFFLISRLTKLLVVLIIIMSSFNSYLTLGWSFFNKYQGYSLADYQAGMWIRNQTPQNSVFITSPTVHSAVSDIGGRLRVLSYTTWPYSHGFNQGLDTVFTRQANIESFYKNPTNIENIKKVISLYHVNYFYLGSEEKSNYPFAEGLLTRQNYLTIVYNSSGIKIYKVP